MTMEEEKEMATGEVREEQTQMTDEQRKEAFEAYQEERRAVRNECSQEIQKVLEKYGCRLTANLTISEYRTVPTVYIVDARKDG